MALATLSAAEAQSLWSQQSWGDQPHWALLTPGGQVCATKAGFARGEAVLEAIHSAGGTPRWESLAAFLEDHPDRGYILWAAVTQAFSLAEDRLETLKRQGKVKVNPGLLGDDFACFFARARGVSFPKGQEGEALAEATYGEVAQALGKFFAVPGWQRILLIINQELERWDMRRSTSIRSLFKDIASQAETQFRQDPYNRHLAEFWMRARETAGLEPEPLDGSFLPLPGSCWPTPEILRGLLGPYLRRRDWEEAMTCLNDLYPQRHPEPLTASGWKDYCGLRGAVKFQQGRILASQGSWSLAAAALKEADFLGGPSSSPITDGIQDLIPLPMVGVDDLASFATTADLQAFRALAIKSVGEDVVEPVPLRPPLRLLVMGNPKWLPGWSNLHLAPELAPWSPAELNWEAASPQNHEKLQAMYQWAPGPRWALLRGEQLRATGAVCPDPGALASILEGEGPALLQCFQKLLAAQPDHLAARRARYALLMARMPNPHLEPILAQDAVAAGVPLAFEPGAPWKPDPVLWGAAAQQVLPLVEAELRRWPEDDSVWDAWIAWARFHPAHPSILSLPQSLCVWSPQGDRLTGLPPRAQKAMDAERRRQAIEPTQRPQSGTDATPGSR